MDQNLKGRIIAGSVAAGLLLFAFVSILSYISEVKAQSQQLQQQLTETQQMLTARDEELK